MVIHMLIHGDPMIPLLMVIRKGTYRTQQVRNSKGWLLLAKFMMVSVYLGTGLARRQ